MCLLTQAIQVKTPKNKIAISIQSTFITKALHVCSSMLRIKHTKYRSRIDCLDETLQPGFRMYCMDSIIRSMLDIVSLPGIFSA